MNELFSEWMGPRDNAYTSLADAIERAIRDGHLVAGTKLPTHRSLARQLGVAVSTITRAYAEANRRGLIDGTAGRGTFVKSVAGAADRTRREGLGPIERLYLPFLQREDAINLSLNEPTPEGAEERLRPSFEMLAKRADLSDLSHYQPAQGKPIHREAGAKWMRKSGIAVSDDDVFVAAGGQTALITIFLALARPGDTALTEWLTWPGAISAGRLTGIRLVPLGMDEQGILPEAFERACAENRPRFLYVMPTLQNPTTAIAGPERRKEIVEIARKHGVLIVEDDAYGFLLRPRAITYYELAPDITIYLTSLSKSISPALRVGYMAVPSQLHRTFRGAARATMSMVSPILLDVANHLIETGAAEEAASFQTSVAKKRMALTESILGLTGPGQASFHFWLKLPPDMPNSAFVASALARGVSVTPGDAFVVDWAQDAGGVRLCLCAEPSEERLVTALNIINDILHSDRSKAPVVV
jgi:DNA-binding transcriptional MocR family regulator